MKGNPFLPELWEKNGSLMSGDMPVRSVHLDSLARRLVQKSYEVIIKLLGGQKEPNTLENRFIYEAYLRVKAILATSNLLSGPPQGVESTLVSDLAMALYMVLIVWVPEREIPAGIIQELRSVVSEVLTEVEQED
jgi:hypothetical protein